MANERLPRWVMVLIPLVISLCATMVGIRLALDYQEHRYYQEQLESTSCLITHHENYTSPGGWSCISTNYASSCSYTFSKTYDEYSVSYTIQNGTVANSTLRNMASNRGDEPRKLGSHHQCFYSPNYVTTVKWERTVEKLDLIIACILFAIAFIFLISVPALFLVPWFIKKMKKQDVAEQGDAIVTMLKQDDGGKYANETTYA